MVPMLPVEPTEVIFELSLDRMIELLFGCWLGAV